jgi:hypothetical protein
MKRTLPIVISTPSNVIPAKAGIYCFLLFYLFIFSLTASFATPPVSISLSYDADNRNLYVEAEHPSYNLDKSYVRLMHVYVNDRKVLTFNYFRQTDYNKFSDDVALTANVGDVIKVELFCTLGGEMSKELKVTKP